MQTKNFGLRAGVMGALLLAALFTALQLTAVTGRDTPDTRNYLSYALTLSGDSRATATDRATAYTCASEQHKPLNWIPWTGDDQPSESRQECERRLTATAAHWATHGNESGMTGPYANSRFMAIYEARPGYPLFLVPFLALFGLPWGIWLAGLTVALAGGLLVLATLRAAGASWPAALTGQALYLALPTGTVAMLPLTDGLALALGAATALGCVLALRGRPGVGWTLLVGGLVLAFWVRYSQTLLLAAALTVAFLALTAGRLWRDRARGATLAVRDWTAPTRHAATLAALCGGLTVACYLTASAVGWPMGADSAQDLLTHHYQRPDVPDLWSRFLSQEGVFWPAWLRRQLSYPALLIPLLLAVWAVLRRPSTFGLVVAALAVSGVLDQAGHPNLDQVLGYRLIVFVWFLPVLGLPLLVDQLREGRIRLPRRPGRRAAAGRIASVPVAGPDGSATEDPSR